MVLLRRPQEAPGVPGGTDRNKGEPSRRQMTSNPSARRATRAAGPAVTVDLPGTRHIREIYADKAALGQPVISIELFPPKTPQGEESLYERALPRLLTAKPDFCSVTYGAGGSTHEKTLEVVDHVQRKHGVTGMAHLTCISSTREEIESYLRDAEALGIKNILALRGDPTRDEAEFVKPDNGFDYSYQLIDFIKTQGDFSIGTAGFPESHMGCSDGKHVDWRRLKTKIERGANFVLTQLFFDNADYFELRDYMVETLRVNVPITPGILPILSTDQVKRFTTLCGASLPQHLAAQLDALGDDTEAVVEFGIDFATRQCEELLRGGAPGLHLYSLNKSRASLQILRNLGLA